MRDRYVRKGRGRLGFRLLRRFARQTAMAPTVHILHDNRRDFEQRGIENVRAMVAAGHLSPVKTEQAQACFNEQECGEKRARRSSAEWRVNIALMLSGLSLL